MMKNLNYKLQLRKFLDLLQKSALYTTFISIIVAVAIVTISRQMRSESEGGRLITLVLSCIITVFGCAAVFVNITLERDNDKLRGCGLYLHDINHTYRDALANCFQRDEASGSPVPEKELLLREHTVLQTVAGRIAAMFNRYINCHCTVTVMLVAEEDARSFCFAWARSDTRAVRCEDVGQKFYLDEHPRFLQAVKIRPDGAPSHFYSADLFRSADAPTNPRAHYRSCIIVPIRFIILKRANSEESGQNLLGYLCVDTMAAGRLNADHHVELMSAFADQMYNFLSLMRHGYKTGHTV